MTAPQRTPAWAYRLFVGVGLLALTVPRMTQMGMFGDGLLYAAIAKNLAHGIGSFWAPVLSSTTYAPFREHPPLGLGLQAAAFWLFGDHAAVERAYSVVVFLLTAFAICRLWRRFLPSELDWLPLFFWLLPSIVTWGVANNMLEVTQTLFTTLAVLLIAFAMDHQRQFPAILAAAAAGLVVCAAVLTKGPVGLFPLASAVTMSVMMARRIRGRALLASGLAVIVATLIFAGLLAYPAARESLSGYWNQQVVASLSGQREMSGGDSAFLRHLLFGVVGRMALIVVIVVLAAPRHGRPNVPWRVAAMFAGVALTASVPLGVSPKLVGHYFLPAAPFFALAAASLTAPAATAILRARSALVTVVPLALAALLVAASVVVVATRGSLDKRDVDLLRDLESVGDKVPSGATVGGCASEEVDWRLHTYLSRLFGLTLTLDGKASEGFFLQSFESCQVPTNCDLAATGRLINLYRCWTIESSDQRIIGSSDHRIIGSSDYRIIASSDQRIIRSPDHRLQDVGAVRGG